jgi:prefoldin subunit 5
MRSEIKELSAQIDVLENQIATLRGILSPVMHMGGVTATLAPNAKAEPDTRSEISKSISGLSTRIRSLSAFIDDTAKNLDLGEA